MLDLELQWEIAHGVIKEIANIEVGTNNQEGVKEVFEKFVNK